MQFVSRRHILRLSFILLLTLYGGGYVYVRTTHLLIHRSGFSLGKTDNHEIAAGDLGRGFNLSYPSYAIFTPARWAETCCWYVAYPPGKPWPYQISISDVGHRPALPDKHRCRIENGQS